MKKILFAVVLSFIGATFAFADTAPTLPDDIAQWSKVVDSTCDVKEGIVLRNVGYAVRNRDESTSIIIIYEKNGTMVYFMEGLIVNGKPQKLSFSIQTAPEQWVLLDKTSADQNNLAFATLGITEEEFTSCGM